MRMWLYDIDAYVPIPRIHHTYVPIPHLYTHVTSCGSAHTDTGTHTNTHTHTLARAHTHTHTHTHFQRAVWLFVALRADTFRWIQWAVRR
jgi:hypothetical protein